jgi:signal transduction histidine kinase
MAAPCGHPAHKRDCPKTAMASAISQPMSKRLLSMAAQWTRGKVARSPLPVQIALARAFLDQSGFSLTVSAIAQLVIAATVSSMVPLGLLIGWMLFAFGLTAYIGWRWKLGRGKPISAFQAPRMVSRAWVWSLAYGLTWGATALFMPYLDWDREVVLIVVACGLCAGAASTMAAIPAAARAFMMSVCLPFVLVFLWETSLPHIMLALMALTLLQSMLLATRASYTVLVDGVEAQVEARKALQALSTAEQHWRELSDTAEAFALFDEDHRLLLWNDGYARLLGIVPESLQRGLPWSRIWQLGQYQRLPEAAALVGNKGDIQHSWTEEHQLRQQWLRSTIRQLANGHVVVSHVDITRMKQRESQLLTLQAQLEEARDQAELASQAKSRFLANMSHELRTPLNAVIGFADLMQHQLRRGGSTDTHGQYAKTIHDSGQHLLAIVEDMLDLARIEAGKVEVDARETDLVELIDAAIPIALGQQVNQPPQIIRDLPAGPVLAKVDPRLTRQAFINLLGNAIKFSRREGRVWVVLTETPDGGLDITVRDEGIGIPVHLIEEVTKPFAQVETPEAKRFGGVGLGLPLAKQFIELMGGTLQIESEAGRGTSAHLLLPKSQRVRTAGKRGSNAQASFGAPPHRDGTPPPPHANA